MNPLKMATRLAELERDNAFLRQQITVAAHWCPNTECEFKKFAAKGPDTVEQAHAIMTEFNEHG